MFLEKVTSQFDRSALMRAPLIPSAVFTAISLVFSGVIVTIFPAIGANFLLLTPVVFVAWFFWGLVATAVIGGLLVPLLPDEIPLVSRLNESRLGRIFLAFVLLGGIGTGVFGFGVWSIIFLLMCLGEYTSRLPHRRQKTTRKKGLFV